MKTPPELSVVQEPEATERKIIHLSGIRSSGAAQARPVSRPWPRQGAWRERLRRAKDRDPGGSGKTG
jgi:hypothetical protein